MNAFTDFTIKVGVIKKARHVLRIYFIKNLTLASCVSPAHLLKSFTTPETIPSASQARLFT